jgi:hypothetical protein
MFKVFFLLGAFNNTAKVRSVMHVEQEMENAFFMVVLVFDFEIQALN